MNATHTGLVAGIILGATGALGGFVAFVIALLLGIIGLVVGRVLDGGLDVDELLGRGRDR